jgi:methionyl-tRNA formyltransferase
VKVLILSPYGEPIAETVARHGDSSLLVAGKIAPEQAIFEDVDFLVSYGYRWVLGPEILSAFGERAANLHISLLPWNRGADPNFWSFFDGTPTGVTIHRIDQGLDTGPVLAQRAVAIKTGATLASSYWELRREVEALFGEVWPAIRSGAVQPVPQGGPGSAHRKGEADGYLAELAAGWETPVATVEALGRHNRERW